MDMAEKTQTTKPNPKPNQSNRPKPLVLSYFYELSLYSQFQIPMLCLSCISMVEKKKKIRKKIISFRGYLSHSSS